MTMKPQSGKERQVALFLLASVRRRKRSGNLPPIRRKTVPLPMLCFVRQGEGTVLLDGAAYRFDPGSLFFFAPGMTIETEASTPQLDYYIVLLQTAVVSAKARQEPVIAEEGSLRLPSFLVPGRLLVEDSRQTLRRFERLHEESRSPEQTAASRSLQHIRLQELLNYIVQETARLVPSKEAVPNLERTIRYMEEQFHMKITLNRLAVIAGFTPSSYSRAFAKTIGMPPIDYLNRIRVDQAKRLLAEANCRIKDVSASVGFENEFYFSRLFKQNVGLSPSLYMKRDRLRIAVASCLALEHNLQSVGGEAVATVNCFRYPGMSDEEYGHSIAAQLTALRKAKPDLIVGDYFHEPYTAILKPIAPVLILANDPDWRVNHRKIAGLAGLEEAAERTIADMERLEREACDALSNSLGRETIILMQVNHRLTRIQGTVRHPLNELFYSGLGLKPGSNIPRNHFRLEFAPEWLPSLQADRLFIHKNHTRAGCENVYRAMQRTEAWKSIKAVRDDNVQLIPNWFRMSWTPPGRREIIAELLAIANMEFEA